MFKKAILAVVIALISFPLAAADLVIPAAGTGPGAGNSSWQTELILHNVGPDPIEVRIGFHGDLGLVERKPFTVPPRGSLVLEDAIATSFGQTAATGALFITLLDNVFLPKLAVNSRTFNRTANGDLGQNVPAYRATEALVPGDTGVIPAATDVQKSRFNFGIAIDAPTVVKWQLLRASGVVASEKVVTYDIAGQQIQYNRGHASLFEVTPENGDIIYARIVSGRAFVYGSLVDELSGDPTFVEATRTRENLLPRFIGVDLQENGTIDIVDADGDHIADAPVTLYVGRFPGFFRVVFEDPEGEPLTLTIIDSGDDVRFIDNRGTVLWYPGAERAGTTSFLTIRASDGIDAVEYKIPVVFLQ